MRAITAEIKLSRPKSREVNPVRVRNILLSGGVVKVPPGTDSFLARAAMREQLEVPMTKEIRIVDRPYESARLKVNPQVPYPGCRLSEVKLQFSLLS